MKQQILSFLSTIKNEILDINRFLYDAKENCFKEDLSSDYIINLLEKYNFEVEKNYLNIPNSFYAKYGNSYPQICYICKFSTGDDIGHIYGNNCNATIALGSSIGLSSILNHENGSVIIIGCPGKYTNGSEIIMSHENIFKDMSIIFSPHVDNQTSLNGDSIACIPLEITFDTIATCINNCKNTSLNISLHTLQFISNLIQYNYSDSYLDHVSLLSDNSPSSYPSSTTIRFEIKSSNYINGEHIENNIRTYIKSLEKVTNIHCKITLFQLPSKEILNNSVISKILSNNLKECGLIHINDKKNVLYPLGIGAVSHIAPTIYPSISITENPSIHCPSKEFMECSISTFAENNIWKAIEALALTGLDFIEREDLRIESIKTLNHMICINKKS